MILTFEARSPEDEFVEPVKTPEAELYRSGWKAVPVLLEVLDDARTNANSRAWALALLFDATGLNGPEYDGPCSADAWGPHQLRFHWPGVKMRGEFEYQPDRIDGPKSLDAVALSEFVRRWSVTRGSLAIRE